MDLKVVTTLRVGPPPACSPLLNTRGDHCRYSNHARLLELFASTVMVDLADYEQKLLNVAVELVELRCEHESLDSQLSHEAERLRVWRAIAPSSFGGRLPNELWPNLEAFLFDGERGKIDYPEEDDIMQDAEEYIDQGPGAQHRLSDRMRFLADTLSLCEDLRDDIQEDRDKVTWFAKRNCVWETSWRIGTLLSHRDMVRGFLTWVCTST